MRLGWAVFAASTVVALLLVFLLSMFVTKENSCDDGRRHRGGCHSTYWFNR